MIPAAPVQFPTIGRRHSYTPTTSPLAGSPLRMSTLTSSTDSSKDESGESSLSNTELRSSIFRRTSAIEASETGSGTDIYAFPQDGKSLSSSAIYAVPGGKGGGKAAGVDGEYHGNPEPMFPTSSVAPMRQMKITAEFRPLAELPSFPESQVYPALPQIEEEARDKVRELPPCVLDCLALARSPAFRLRSYSIRIGTTCARQ